jgi:hypothetical protein
MTGAQCFGDAAADVPSYARIEQLIAEYTGVESIEHNMCPNTCIAYTGPFANLNHPSTWSWAVFRDVNTWQAHGTAVAAAAQYLPGSFDRKPRNPAEKSILVTKHGSFKCTSSALAQLSVTAFFRNRIGSTIVVLFVVFT